MTRPFKTAIFDLDGTLLDTICDLAGSMNATLVKYGFSALPIKHHKSAIGNGLRIYASRCIPEECVSDTLLDAFVKDVAAHYAQNYKNETRPYAGIVSLLDFLQENGVTLAVLSNKMDAFTKDLVAMHFKNRFRCVYGERENVPKKPNPRMAISIAQECGAMPCKTLFIGDSIYDIKTAKNAGMTSIAALWGYQSREKLSSEHPDFLAETPEDIINIMKDRSM